MANRGPPAEHIFTLVNVSPPFPAREIKQKTRSIHPKLIRLRLTPGDKLDSEILGVSH